MNACREGEGILVRWCEVHGQPMWNDDATCALRASPVDREDELGAAWAEAEAALPEGWDFGITMTGVEGDGRYHASAAPLSSSFAYRDGKYADADTPAAALRALAARLAKDPTDER